MNNWLVRIALFVLFLFPVVIDQYSVNYLFVLFAGFMVLQARRLRMPSKPLLVAIAVYVLIYLTSVLLDAIGGAEMLPRRTVSFAIFMSIFAFSVVDLDDSDVRAFKIALVVFSFVFSLHALVTMFLVGGNGYGYGLKNVVGSQRYGFLYMLALFVLIHMPVSGRWRMLAKAVVVYIILAGILLTFSRSSIIALAVVLTLYVLMPFAFRAGWSMQGVRMLGLRVGVGLGFAIALFLVIPVTFQFYGELIVDRYAGAAKQALVEHVETLPQTDIFIPEGSEGTRLAIWKAVIEHTMNEPLLGSGYLGSWTLKGVITGSAHNQYFDVLMRTGIPGLTVYMLVLAVLFRFLWSKDQGLFWGGLTVLLYGLFQETFKESQGAFVLAFLIGMYSTHRPAGAASRIGWLK